MSNPIKEYSFRKDVEEDGIEIIQLEQFFAEKDDLDKFKLHRIHFYMIIFITHGKGTHLIDFKEYDYEKQSIIFIGKDQVNAWVKRKGVKGFLLLFTDQFLYHNQIKFKDISYTYPYNSSLYQPIMTLPQKDNYQSFHSLFFYLYQEYHLPKTGHKQAILQNLLRTFLLKIQSQATKQDILGNPEEKALFIRFQKLLEEKISETRNTNDYCQMLHTSYRKLNHACKILTQMTAKAFIDHIVILKAKKQLIDGHKNITEVSYLFGFEEVTNFTKFFKKHTSLSPKEFLAQAQ